MVSEITAASEEQARGIEQINSAVSDMDRIVQQSAASAEQGSSASEELAAQAQELGGLVGRFQLEDGMYDSSNSSQSASMMPGLIRPQMSQQRSRQSLPARGSGSSRQNDRHMIPFDDGDDQEFVDF